MSDKMRKTLESTNAVHISNPKALEFQVSLLGSLAGSFVVRSVCISFFAIFFLVYLTDRKDKFTTWSIENTGM